jgi:hypothetical protein
VTIHMLQNFGIVQKLFVTFHMVQSFDIVELCMTIHMALEVSTLLNCLWIFTSNVQSFNINIADGYPT